MYITLLLASSNELGYIQVTTHVDNKSDLETLGFVDNVTKLKPLKEKKAKVKIKAPAKEAAKAVKDGD